MINGIEQGYKERETKQSGHKRWNCKGRPCTDAVVNTVVADSARRAKTEQLIKVTGNGSGHKTRGDSVSSYAEETANRYSNCALQFDELLQMVLALIYATCKRAIALSSTCLTGRCTFRMPITVSLIQVF